MFAYAFSDISMHMWKHLCHHYYVISIGSIRIQCFWVVIIINRTSFAKADRNNMEFVCEIVCEVATQCDKLLLILRCTTCNLYVKLYVNSQSQLGSRSAHHLSVSLSASPPTEQVRGGLSVRRAGSCRRSRRGRMCEYSIVYISNYKFLSIDLTNQFVQFRFAEEYSGGPYTYTTLTQSKKAVGYANYALFPVWDSRQMPAFFSA